jgi:hypothetical protein
VHGRAETEDLVKIGDFLLLFFLLCALCGAMTAFVFYLNFRHHVHAMDSSRSKRFFSMSKCLDWLKWPLQPPVQCCERCFPWGLRIGGMKLTVDLFQVLRLRMVLYLHPPCMLSGTALLLLPLYLSSG